MTDPLVMNRGEGDRAAGEKVFAAANLQLRLADAEEIAAPICFLLSSEASFMTGSLWWWTAARPRSDVLVPATLRAAFAGQVAVRSMDGQLQHDGTGRPPVHRHHRPAGCDERAAPPWQRRAGRGWDEFAADPDLWVAIVTGAGDRAFSAGNDLKYQAGGGDRSAQPATGFGGLTARFDLNKPVIAAVNGVAMGGGSRSRSPAT
jgi:hypothetical protein